MDERFWAEPTLGKTDAVRQHYVPRMLLANFADDGAVSVHEIETGRIFPASINNVGVQSAFYDVLDGSKLLSAETWLAGVEGAAASIIRSIIGDPDAILSLSPEEQEALARFIAAQLLRTPKAREQEEKMRRQLVDHLKKAGRNFLKNTESPEDAERIWNAWKDKGDDFFLKEETPHQPARTTAAMLGKVKGFANILLAMPWRAGLTDSQLYMSDNPVSRYPTPTLRWPPFQMHVYLLPLSPLVVLRIGPGLSADKRFDPSRVDYSAWETSFIKHVVTNDAHRYLYGPGPYLPQDCASTCLHRISMAKMAHAVGLQDLNPTTLI